MNSTSNFTEGKILSPLIKFSIPVLLALFLQAMYGAADLLIVGQFGDASSVSAVATGSQVMQTITGIVTGLTMGTTIALGQSIGKKKYDESANTIGASVILFAIIAVILSAIMLLVASPFAKLMNAPEEAFDKTVHYITVCSLGIIFIIAYNVISGIFRGLGNSKLPLIFVLIACITNIIGDLVLVGIFHLDAIGAAIATIFAQAVSVILSIIIIKKKGLGFDFSKKNIKLHKRETSQILKLGSPIALQDALTNISFLVITAILNSLGLIASAAVGVSEKIVIFVMLVPMSFMSSVSAFVAQNIGAKKIDRAKKTLFYATGISLIFGILMFFFTFFYGHLLAGIFAKEEAVILATAEYMKAYAIDCILVCILFCFTGFFNGCGKTIFVMIQGLVCSFGVRIPYSYFVSKLPDATMFKIGLATPISTVLGIILCFAYYFYTFKKNKLQQ